MASESTRTRVGTTGVSVPPSASHVGARRHAEHYGYSVDEGRARDTVRAILTSPYPFLDTTASTASAAARSASARPSATSGLPEGAVISTKLDRDPETLRFDAAEARRSVEASLEALGLQKVHILHLHDPEHARDLAEIAGPGGAIEEMFRMKEEGLADAVGSPPASST